MIRVEHEPVSGGSGGGEIATIVLDRADKRNALTPDMLHNLRVAVEHAGHEHHARAVVLRGEGQAFCAGFDLSLCQDDPLAMRAMLTGLSNTIRALRRCPCPVVIAAHGAAIAGGCALLGGADFVVTDAHAKLGYPVTRLGVSPAVSSPFLRQSVGDGNARARLLDSELIDGRRACAIGLAHECVEREEDVLARAMGVARAFAAKPPHALHQTKRWLNELDGSLDERAIDGALHASLGLTGGEEERELLARMWEKRP